MKGLRIASITFWLFAAGFFSLGMATAFWPKVDGYMIYGVERGYMAGGYTTRWASKGGPVYLQKVSYEYRYGDVTYRGGQTCFCLPIAAVNLHSPGTRVPVYVFPPYLGVSVLRPGPDLILTGALALAGLACWQLRRMMEGYFSRLYEERLKRIRKG